MPTQQDIRDYSVPTNLIGDGEMRMNLLNPDQDLNEEI